MSSTVRKSAGKAARRSRPAKSKAAKGVAKKAATARAASRAAPRRALLVLGMHRSGTSAIARVLSLCGAALPQHLMPPSEKNPVGYFESQAIFELHEKLLAEAGARWNDLSPLSEDWLRSPAAAPWIERLAEAVQDEFGDAPLFVLKDPRICRLVPLWKEVLARIEVEPSFVLMIRNPLEVAASLEKAEGIASRRGMLLWLDHFLSAERDTRGDRRTFASYDDLMDDWRRVMRGVSEELDLAIPRQSRRAQAEIDRFLASKLRHQRIPVDELFAREDVAEWVQRAFKWIGAALGGRRASPRALDELAGELQLAESAYGPLLAAADLEIESERSQAHRLQEEIGRLGQEATTRDEEIRQLSHGLEDSREDLRGGGAEIARLRELVERREDESAQLIEAVKLVVRFSASMIHGTDREVGLEAIDQALEIQAPSAIPQIAATGLRLAQQSAETERLSEEAGRLRETLAARERDAAEATAERARLSDEVTSLRESLGQTRQESEERAGIVSRLSAEVGELRARHETEIDTLRAESVEAEEVAVVLRSERVRLEELRGRLEDQLDNCTADLGRASSTAELLRQSVEQAESALTEEVALREAGDAERSRLSAEATRLRQELERDQRQSADLAQARDQLARELSDQANRAQELERNLKLLRDGIDDRDFFIEELNARLSAIEASRAWRASRPFRTLGRGLSAIRR